MLDGNRSAAFFCMHMYVFSMPGQKHASYLSDRTNIMFDPNLHPMASACPQPATRRKPWLANLSSTDIGPNSLSPPVWMQISRTYATHNAHHGQEDALTSTIQHFAVHDHRVCACTRPMHHQMPSACMASSLFATAALWKLRIPKPTRALFPRSLTHDYHTS